MRERKEIKKSHNLTLGLLWGPQHTEVGGFLPGAATYLLSSVNLPRQLSRGLPAMGDLLARAWSPLPGTGRRLMLT